MAVLVILVLGILWAAVLVPPILRSRSEAGSSPAGVGDFLNRLRSGLGAGRSDGPAMTPLLPPLEPLGMSPGVPMGPVRVPGGMSPTQRRQRDVLVGLLAACGVTFLMALMGTSVVFWVLHLLADAALGGYVFLLLQLKARRSERLAKVRPLGPVAPLEPAGFGNVMPFAPRRFGSAISSHVEAPREATVLALRRTGSW